MLTYKIKYQNKIFNCKADETLIDAFSRHAIEVNFSCKKGICHACMMQCSEGVIPENSQAGLKPEQINNQYFLPCSCRPVSDMSISEISSKPITESNQQNKESTKKQLSSIDDEIWLALDKGKKLKIILDEFYSRVYKDDKLSGFFRNSTQQRSSEKQYLFMRQLFTGEKIYFGYRPKNAHHWMIISDELFDYREKLLSDCLREYKLAEHLIKYWVSLDESFRKDIVKQTAFPKKINGVELPLNGYETLIIDEGTLCDGCNDAIDKGETVKYHLRLGSTYCHHCMELEHTEQTV